MFSPRERDFLELLVRSRAPHPGRGGELLMRFPNPIYRRKLLWGIRRKAARAAGDWELYVRVARIDPRVLPESGRNAVPPLAVDPLVALGPTLRSVLRVGRRTPARLASPPRSVGRR